MKQQGKLNTPVNIYTSVINNINLVLEAYSEGVLGMMENNIFHQKG